MIKNLTGLCLALLVAPVGCRDRDVPSAELQGVIELDERPLGFELPGRLREVPARRGQLVKKGQVLASIDDGLELPLREARRADLRSARAQLELLKVGARREEIDAAAAQVRAAAAVESAARDGLARARQLFAGHSIPKAQLDDAQSAALRATAERQALDERVRVLRKGSRRQELDAAQARVEAAEAALALSEARLTRMELHAPMDGQVLEVHAEPGQVVSAGAPVITLGDVQRPYLDLFVPQGELRGVRPGLATLVRVDAEAQPFRAAVEEVSRKTEFTPRYFFSTKERPNLVVRVRVRVEDPQTRLHAGVPARATLDRPAFREGT